MRKKRARKERKFAKVIAQRLKEARKNKGLTQQALAQATGLSQTAVSAYERGFMEPTVTNLVALAEALEVDIYWLLGLEKK